MATEFILHIDLQNVPSETSKAKEKLDSVTGNGPKTSEADKKDTSGLLKTAKAVGAVSLGKQVISSATSYATYRLTTYGARYGDSARQNEINNTMTLVTAGMDFGKSTISGAVAGAAAVPSAPGLGAAVGAVLAIVSESVSKVVDIVKNNEEYNRQRNIENLSENRSLERLGMLASDRNRR